METKPQNRFRLAPKESPTPTFPTAGAVASHLFLAPVEGTVPLEPLSEPVIAFQPTLSIGELKTIKLRTSGYDDPQLEVIDIDNAPEPEVPAPPMQTAPRQLKFTPKAPPTAKMEPACSAIQPAAGPLNSPRMVASTLRTKFVLGANPNKPALRQPAKPVEQPVAVKPVQAAPVAAKPVQSTPVVSKPVQATPVQTKPAAAAQAAPVVKPAQPPAPAAKPASPPQVTIKTTPAPVKPAAAAAATAPAASAAPAVKPVTKPPEPAKPQEQPKPAVQAAPVEPAKPAAEKPPEKPVEKPVEKPADKTVEKTADKPKINVRPAQPPPAPAVKRPQAPPAPSRPAIAARDHGNAVPVEREEPLPPPPPSPKPKVQPIRPSATPVHDVPVLGMPHDAEMSPLGGFWAKASAPVKGLVIVAVLGLLGGGGYFAFRGGSTPGSTTASNVSDGPATIMPLPGAIISGGGWSPNWGSDSPTNKGKQISIFRPTMTMADYSIVFNGQVEKKAMGWIFRAHDPKNYYVYKLKIVKPGTEPVMALEKFAVINGKEDVHTQVMLNTKASLDTVWSIRTDVQGNKFTTYVQDKLADYMSDDRIKIGGAGFYNDPGEYAQIKNSAFYHLTYKK